MKNKERKEFEKGLSALLKNYGFKSENYSNVVVIVKPEFCVAVDYPFFYKPIKINT